jgi:hypothetical protein
MNRLILCLSLFSTINVAQSNEWKWFYSPTHCEDLNGKWIPKSCSRISVDENGVEIRQKLDQHLLDLGNRDFFNFGEQRDSYFKIENSCDSLITTTPAPKPFNDREYSTVMAEEDFAPSELDEKERVRSVSIGRNKVVITDQVNRDAHFAWYYGPIWAAANEQYERIEYTLEDSGNILTIRTDNKVVRPEKEASHSIYECKFQAN